MKGPTDVSIRIKQKMTNTEARSFDGYSDSNAMLIYAALECSCKPYHDVFTYNRWEAQGYQVQRDEKGIKIPSFRKYEDDDGNTKTVPTKPSHVFCRCQVK